MTWLFILQEMMHNSEKTRQRHLAQFKIYIISPAHGSLLHNKKFKLQAN